MSERITEAELDEMERGQSACLWESDAEWSPCSCHSEQPRLVAEVRRLRAMIVAAPELLEAARLALSVLSHMARTLEQTPEDGTAIPLLKAAITKAEGKSKA